MGGLTAMITVTIAVTTMDIVGGAIMMMTTAAGNCYLMCC